MSTSLHSFALQLHATYSPHGGRLRSACVLLPLASAACSGVDRSELAASSAHDPSSTESTGDVEPGPSPSGNVDTDSVEPGATSEPAAINTAFYLPMRDGVRIAVDLWLPGGAANRTALSEHRYGALTVTRSEHRAHRQWARVLHDCQEHRVLGLESRLADETHLRRVKASISICRRFEEVSMQTVLREQCVASPCFAHLAPAF